MDGGKFSSGVQTAGNYFTWGGNEISDSAVPIWMVNLWKSGNNNGTGVFIPNVVKSRRRRNNPGRMNNERRKMYKPVQAKQT